MLCRLRYICADRSGSLYELCDCFCRLHYATFRYEPRSDYESCDEDEETAEENSQPLLNAHVHVLVEK
jgi:hypothetical protein